MTTTADISLDAFVELDERESNGIRVTLLWNRVTNQASVLVSDEQSGEASPSLSARPTVRATCSITRSRTEESIAEIADDPEGVLRSDWLAICAWRAR